MWDYVISFRLARGSDSYSITPCNKKSDLWKTTTKREPLLWQVWPIVLNNPSLFWIQIQKSTIFFTDQEAASVVLCCITGSVVSRAPQKNWRGKKKLLKKWPITRQKSQSISHSMIGLGDLTRRKQACGPNQTILTLSNQTYFHTRF